MKRRAVTRLLGAMAAGAMVVSAASSPALAGMAEDEAEIRALWESYSASRVDADAEAWLSLWDEAGIKMGPGRPAVSKAVLDENVPGSFVPGSVKSMTITPAEVVILGDWAFSSGTYVSDRVSKGEEVSVDGKFLTVLKRQSNGSWKIYRDMSNSNTK